MTPFVESFVASLPWLGLLQLLAVSAFGLLFGVCPSLRDRGWGASKIVGLVLATYAVWLVGHFLRITPTTVRFVFGGFVLFGVVALVMNAREIGRFLARRGYEILVGEGVLLLTWCVMLALRVELPQITYVINDYAAEKVTDFAIFNAVTTSPTFPPHSPWLAGLSLNYYYFGHLMGATMGQALGVPASVAYNLALVSTAALLAGASFFLCLNFVGRARLALLGAFLIVAGGNVDGLYQFLEAILKPRSADQPFGAIFDFWRSSRAVGNTITEFPAFSLLLGDLHAHLSGLLLYVGAANLALQLALTARRAGHAWGPVVANPGGLLLMSIMMGAMYATNAWDVLSFAGFFGVLLLAAAPLGRVAEDKRAADGTVARLTWVVWSATVVIMTTAIGIGGWFVQFYLNFAPPRVGTVTSWGQVYYEAPILMVPAELRTRAFEFFNHWGLLLLLPVCVLAALGLRTLSATRYLPEPQRSLRRMRLALAAAAAACAGALLMVTGQHIMSALLPMAAAAALLALLVWARGLRLRLMLALSALFFAVTATAEHVLLNDVFSGAGERINTVFKSYYPLWVVAVLLFVMSLRWALVDLRNRQVLRGLVVATMFVIVLIAAIYPVMGLRARMLRTQEYQASRGLQYAPVTPEPLRHLDGLAFLRYENPTDYALVKWLLANAPRTARVVEEPGAQYTYAGRISSYTGRPAVAGWVTHERSWRGVDAQPLVEARSADADTIYRTSSPATAARLLLEYAVDYIIVGEAERQRYPNLDESVWAAFASPVFRAGDGVIYQTNLQQMMAVSKREDTTATTERVTRTDDVSFRGIIGDASASDANTTTPVGNDANLALFDQFLDDTITTVTSAATTATVSESTPTVTPSPALR